MYNGFCITVFNFLNDHTLLQFSSFGRAHAFGLFRTFDLWIDFVYEQHKKNVRKTKTYFGLRFCCKHSWLDAIWQPDFHRCLILAEILRRLDASWIPLGIPPSFLPCACWPDSLSPSLLKTCYAGYAWQKEYNLTLQ